jgi:hypothetical protein
MNSHRNNPLKNLVLVGMLASTGVQAIDLQCVPRESFPSFVVHFKSSQVFRESRIVFPILVKRAGSEDTPASNTLVSLAEYRDLESFPLVTTDREAEFAGGEGELCETTNASLDDRELIQGSCDTDVYGNAYHFIRTL